MLSGDKGNIVLPVLPEPPWPDTGHKLSMLKPLHILLSMLHLVPKKKRVVLSLHVKIRLEVDVHIWDFNIWSSQLHKSTSLSSSNFVMCIRSTFIYLFIFRIGVASSGCFHIAFSSLVHTFKTFWILWVVQSQLSDNFSFLSLNRLLCSGTFASKSAILDNLSWQPESPHQHLVLELQQ